MGERLQKIVRRLEPQDLCVGSYGHAVWSLQLALQELSLFNGVANGFFGEDTDLALRRLQRAVGLAETGEFNIATWYALTFWMKPTKQLGLSSSVSVPWQWPLRLLQLFRSRCSVAIAENCEYSRRQFR
ncbi:peptidoglycan-binding domain-containing protein [Oscillatoria sp. CS-180]|uniref:peptidoglycan-binding domain-containing protein n=1 Tax=Oscillatoria sp. CS-180 TaxID=3021720 RepID=UPI00232BC6BD|nr:peptidoglycan-binding domain-containing protein [Oscillatoria sp. CS-180]MDB9527747.1 peptidoglycan-binding domain-containing protein [Oscillatoria sp. CS-180]